MNRGTGRTFKPCLSQAPSVALCLPTRRLVVADPGASLEVVALECSGRFERGDLLGYLCQWTMKRTGQPEPLVREVLDGASRWLDEIATSLAQRDEEATKADDDDETGAASA